LTVAPVQDSKLWEDVPRRQPFGEVRRALDRDLRAAGERGRTFLETEVAAVRRQANDLDRLERLVAGEGGAKTWDYNPKTTAAQAYLDAVRRLFGADDDDDDPFLAAVRELDAQAAARPGTAAALDPARSDPPD
jgi:hypothetical protein